jgi:16S rRNA (guanine527-N7)-methyltransferase
VEVSRETLIARHFPDVARVHAYAKFLETAGIERGLIGPREADRIWERHILNCLPVTTLFTEDATVFDIGSGAGLPGIVIALARPDLKVTLIEPLERRVEFLQEAVEGLDQAGLGRGRRTRLRETQVDHAHFLRAAEIDGAGAGDPARLRRGENPYHDDIHPNDLGQQSIAATREALLAGQR